jgi:hypothetical protein
MNRSERRRRQLGRDVPTREEVQMEQAEEQMRLGRVNALEGSMVARGQYAVTVITQTPRDTKGYEGLRDDAVEFLRALFRKSIVQMAGLPEDIYAADEPEIEDEGTV